MTRLETVLVDHLPEFVILVFIVLCLIGTIPSIAVRLGRREPAPRRESMSERHARLDAAARDEIELRATRPVSSNRKSGRTGVSR